MKNRINRKFELIILLILFALFTSARTFVHPGISHKLSDLDRMKSMVQAGIEPWKTSFADLQKNSYSSYNYTVQWNKDSTTIYTTIPTYYEKIKYDGLAAYYNALMWYITGDTRNADKCVEIFNAWSNIKRIVTGGTDCLDAGRVIWKALEAAEIIKSTYSGWAQADIDKFKAMLVYPGYSSTTTPTAPIASRDATFYWYMYNGDYGRHGNQGLFGMRGIMAMGIFMDNEIMYDRALRYLKGMSHRSDDLPYPSGPPIVSTTPASTSNSYYDEYTPVSPYQKTDSIDYGYNELIKNYIWENGQSEESSRDQGHALVGVSIINTMCEMAWNQGDDLYSFMNYRPLLGLEFYYRYNVSFTNFFSDQPTTWEPTISSGEFIRKRDRSGRWTSKRMNPWVGGDTLTLSRGTDNSAANAPIYEMVLGHYKSRLNLPNSMTKWTQRGDSISLAQYGYEQQGFQVDYSGFGGLTFHRVDSCAGDPVTFVNKFPVFGIHKLPGKIEAEDYDYFANQPQGRTFYELSSTKIANAYRPDSAVTVNPCTLGGYKVSDMVAGEWLTYTVNVPLTTTYTISVNYSAATSGGKLRMAFDNVTKIPETALPITGTDVWSDYTLGTKVSLTAGVQGLRLYVSGTSNVLELNSISVLPETTGTKSIVLKSVNSLKSIYLSWTTQNLVPNSYSIYRSSSSDFSNPILLESNVLTTSFTDFSIVTGNTYYYQIQANDGISNIYSNVVSATGQLVTVTSVTSGNWSSGSTWNTGSVPARSDNVVIASGHAITLTGTAGCSKLTVNGSLLDGSSYTLTADTLIVNSLAFNNPAAITVNGPTTINAGAVWTLGGTLTTNSDVIINGQLKGPTTAGGTVQTWMLQGDNPMVKINSTGILGATGIGVSGESLRVFLNHTDTATFTGSGIVNIGRFHTYANNITPQTTIVDINMNINNTATGVAVFSLQNGSNGSSNKTLTINEGKTVKLSKSAGYFHYFNSLGATGNTGGNMNYNINGTLDVSAGEFNLSTNGLSPLQILTVNVGPNGVLKLGAVVNLKPNLYGQNVFVNVANGGIVDGSSTSLTTTSSSNSGAGGTAWFTLNGANAVIKRKVTAAVATPFWIGVSNTSCDSVIIKPTATGIFSISIDSTFTHSPNNIKLSNPRIWTITPASSTSADFTFYPSMFANTSNPVIGKYIGGAWTESTATLSGNAFSNTGSSLSALSTQFATGSKRAFLYQPVTSITSGNWSSPSTWNTGSVPTSLDDVVIAPGHIITLTASASCNSLLVNGTALNGAFTLTVSDSLKIASTAFTNGSVIVANGPTLLKVGAVWTLGGQLTTNDNVNVFGQLRGVTIAGGTVQTWLLQGADPTVTINSTGVLGGTGIGIAGEGLRIFLGHTGTATFTGTGIVNIARLYTNSGNTNTQSTVADIDMNINNTDPATSTTTFSLQMGNMGTASKSFTVNAGKTVALTQSNGCFHNTGNSGVARTGGNITYNINGTLDVSAGQFDLVSNTSTSSQVLTVNIGSVGMLKLGSVVNLKRSIAGQNVYVNVADGGIVDGSTTALTSYSNLGDGGTAWFSLNGNNAKLNRKVTAGIPTPFWTGISNSSCDSLIINPTLDAVFSVNVHNLLSGIPNNTALTNPREWNIESSVPTTATITLCPSLALNTFEAVIGVYKSGLWSEMAATYSPPIFIGKSNFVFSADTLLLGLATGTSGAYSSITTGVVDTIRSSIYVCVNEKQLIIKGLNPNDLISIWDINGQQIKNEKASSDQVATTLPIGVFLVKVKSIDEIKIVKVIIK
ncbi:MAG: DUF5010 C-terminal domain-containing protein [Paludibacter sp.]|nr:DUF5010 C-terminal domain-containing protein [Paludibacter sp.]